MVAEDRWIIDGNMMRSLEMRFARADAAIQFDFPRLLCFWRIYKRLFSRDPRICDRAEGCSEQVSWDLIAYLWRYNAKYGQQIEDLRKRYPHVVFHRIQNDKEAHHFLASLQ